MKICTEKDFLLYSSTTITSRAIYVPAHTILPPTEIKTCNYTRIHVHMHMLTHQEAVSHHLQSQRGWTWIW